MDHHLLAFWETTVKSIRDPMAMNAAHTPVTVIIKALKVSKSRLDSREKRISSTVIGRSVQLSYCCSVKSPTDYSIAHARQLPITEPLNEPLPRPHLHYPESFNPVIAMKIDKYCLFSRGGRRLG